MAAYAGILFAISALFALFYVLIYEGKTELIHDYHQIKVTDKIACGKAFGKVFGVMAGATALSGVIALFDEFAMRGVVAVLVIGIIAIVQVQRKYNGGVF